MGCGSACGVLTEIAWMLLAKEGQDMHQKYTIDTWESVRYNTYHASKRICARKGNMVSWTDIISM